MTERSTVRPATEQDVSAIAALAMELGYPAATDAMRERVKAVSASPTDLLLVAGDATGTTIGWLQAHASQIIESGFRVEIVGLIVSKAARRGGIGRSLVLAAERWATGIGAAAIVVRSNIKREESHGFYSALDFRRIKTQHVYRKSLVTTPHP
jgi:predicted N-acetyltransferase YhbS